MSGQSNAPAAQAGSEPAVTLRVADGVATLTLNSPATRNAIDGRLTDALLGAVDALARRPDLRVAVIRAAGPMFCPGASMGWLRPDEPGMPERVDALLGQLNPMLLRLCELPAVIVAAVHGAVAGGGLGLMNLADLVIAAEDTKFNLAYCSIGATPDLGASYHLPRLVGERRAMELMLLSEGFGAARARELGLVNFVVPAASFEQEVDRLVARLAAGAAGAHAAIKRLTYCSLGSTLHGQLEAERAEIVAAAAGGEFSEGVRAFGARRAPDFRGVRDARGQGTPAGPGQGA